MPQSIPGARWYTCRNTTTLRRLGLRKIPHMIDPCQSILEGNPLGLPRTGYAGFGKTVQAGKGFRWVCAEPCGLRSLRWVEAGVFTAFNAGQEQ